MQPSDLNLYPVWNFVCFPVIGTAFFVAERIRRMSVPGVKNYESIVPPHSCKLYVDSLCF